MDMNPIRVHRYPAPHFSAIPKNRKAVVCLSKHRELFPKRKLPDVERIPGRLHLSEPRSHFPVGKESNGLPAQSPIAPSEEATFNGRARWFFPSPGAPSSNTSEEEPEVGLPVESPVTCSEEWITSGRLGCGFRHTANHLSLSRLEEQEVWSAVSDHQPTPKRRLTIRDTMGASCATVYRLDTPVFPKKDRSARQADRAVDFRFETLSSRRRKAFSTRLPRCPGVMMAFHFRRTAI